MLYGVTLICRLPVFWGMKYKNEVFNSGLKELEPKKKNYQSMQTRPLQLNVQR